MKDVEGRARSATWSLRMLLMISFLINFGVKDTKSNLMMNMDSEVSNTTLSNSKFHWLILDWWRRRRIVQLSKSK